MFFAIAGEDPIALRPRLPTRIAPHPLGCVVVHVAKYKSQAVLRILFAMQLVVKQVSSTAVTFASVQRLRLDLGRHIS